MPCDLKTATVSNGRTESTQLVSDLAISFCREFHDFLLIVKYKLLMSDLNNNEKPDIIVSTH